MSETTTDLNTQIAQRLFGWVHTAALGWRDAEGAAHYQVPVYATENGYTEYSATAQVWQWLETDGPVNYIAFAYRTASVQCEVGRFDHAISAVYGYGPTWPEALCRAALALADKLAGEGEVGG